MSDEANWQNKAKELAAAHWGYVVSVLLAHGVNPNVVDQCGFHYRSAFIHGFKHGVEFCAEQDERP